MPEHNTHSPVSAALKERIGRLLAAVLPVATSGREARSSSSTGFTRSTTISIRNRTSEQEAPAAAAADGKKKGGQGEAAFLECGFCGVGWTCSRGHARSCGWEPGQAHRSRHTLQPFGSESRPCAHCRPWLPVTPGSLSLSPFPQPSSWSTCTLMPRRPLRRPTLPPCLLLRRCLARLKRPATRTFWSSCRWEQLCIPGTVGSVVNSCVRANSRNSRALLHATMLAFTMPNAPCKYQPLQPTPPCLLLSAPNDRRLLGKTMRQRRMAQVWAPEQRRRQQRILLPTWEGCPPCCSSPACLQVGL